MNMTDDTMPRRFQGVHRRSDSAHWQYQKKAPRDLRHLYDSPWAFRGSLGTGDLEEANFKASQIAADLAQRFKQQRLSIAGQEVDEVTPEMARLVAQGSLHHLLEDEELRIDVSRRKRLRRVIGLGGVPLLQTEAGLMGLTVGDTTPGAREGYRHFAKTIFEALEAETPVRPAKPTPEMLSAAKGLRLRNVFERWKVSKKRGPDSVGQTERALVLYESHTGNPPITQLRRDQGDAFRAWLIAQPGASKTHHDRFTAVKTLLNFARKELEWIPKNPWEGLDIEHAPQNPGKPWTTEQICSFFSLPLFQHFELPTKAWRAGGEAAYWIPILGLFSGARVGELAQLRTVDIVIENGHALVSINEDADGATVKTAAGIRKVPLHSELVRLGLLDYVEERKRAGDDSLWPKLKSRGGKPGSYFSDWFGKFRRDHADMSIPRFHDLRHTARTAMTEAGFDSHILDRITGHAIKGSVGNQQYSHPREILRRAVESIRFEGLILPRVYKTAQNT